MVFWRYFVVGDYVSPRLSPWRGRAAEAMPRPTAWTWVCWKSTTDSSIEGADVDAWILGDAFLRNVYSAHRSEPRSVGLASGIGAGGEGGWENVPSAAVGVASEPL